MYRGLENTTRIEQRHKGKSFLKDSFSPNLKRSGKMGVVSRILFAATGLFPLQICLPYRGSQAGLINSYLLFSTRRHHGFS
jgi:hypothetical protein